MKNTCVSEKDIHEHEHAHEHEHEHECECCEHSHGGGKFDTKQIVQLCVGTVFFSAAFFLKDFSFYLFLISYVILGAEVLWDAGRNLVRGKLMDENFLMGAATLGALLLGEYAEAVAVMLLFQVGEIFQGAAVAKAKQSIGELLDISSDYANIQRDGELVRVDPAEVRIGDIIVVKPGERIPLDGYIVEGGTFLDTRAVTGESKPKRADVGDNVISGSINQSGLIKVSAAKLYSDSTASKIVRLVEEASRNKGKTEDFITKFAKVYTPVVVGAAALLAIVPSLVTGEWSVWCERALVFLVISCPCALVISVPLSFFAGIGSASRSGILVKGSNFLEALNKVDTVVFDKTGTLTNGVFEVTSLQPSSGISQQRLLELAAYAESSSNHPIAQSILEAYGDKPNLDRISNYKEKAGCGVFVLLDGVPLIAGNAKHMRDNGISIPELHSGGTVVHIAHNNIYSGYIIIADTLKADAHQAIDGIKAEGAAKTIMLTGDNQKTADAVGKDLGIDEIHAGLLPQDKLAIMEELTKDKRGTVAFVGDGINDAPVLAGADVGIAMGLGADAAIAAADIVFMTSEPSKLTEAMRIAKRTRAIVTQNIALALGVKAVVMVAGALGYAGMWWAVFADVGVCLIAVVNAVRGLKNK